MKKKFDMVTIDKLSFNGFIADDREVSEEELCAVSGGNSKFSSGGSVKTMKTSRDRPSVQTTGRTGRETPSGPSTHRTAR